MIRPWMMIGLVTFLVALGGFFIRPRDVAWATRLERPHWMTFEPAIPLIWSVIFFCGAWSATLAWNHDPGSLKTWSLMGIYLILEIITVSYIPLTLRFRSLPVGTVIGALGAVLGIALALLVLPISGWAALLLVPYVIWSPIGTYTTRRMEDLNPDAT